jgi:hypothetical protein
MIDLCIKKIIEWHQKELLVLEIKIKQLLKLLKKKYL